MGDKNVIALLTSINGNLKKIVETSQTNGTQSKEEVSEKITQSLNTGTVLTGDVVKPKAEQGKIGDIVISAATVASLKTLPVVLLAFSKVKEKDLDSFVKTLETIKESVDSFSDMKSLDKSIKSLNDISNFMLILEKTNFTKAAVSVKAANSLGFASGLTHIIEGIIKAVDKAGDISNKDIKKLEAAMKSTEVLNSLVKSVGLVVLSVGGLALLIETVGLKEVMTAAGVSMGILVALSGLAVGLAVVTKNIKGSTKSLDGITGFILKMQGIVLTTLAVGVIASMAWPEIIKGFAATAGIILGYTLIAALVSGLGKFIAADINSFDVIPKMAAWGMAITLGTLLMGVLASAAWPEILIGFAAVSGVILGYTAIAALVSVIGKLSPAFKKDIAAITFMSGAAIALTLATTLLGYVAELAWPQILYGFTATSSIILGYSGIAALASKSAKGMYAAAKDFITIGAVIAGAELLLLGAIGLGKLLEKSSPGALAAAIVGIGGIIFAIDGVAKIAQKHTKTLGKAHINFAIAAGALASAEAIVLAALGISKLINSEKDVYAAVGILVATGAVTTALIKILKTVETSKKTLSVGAKNLLLVAGAALAAESIILGSVLIGKLAKEEDILPAAGVLLASGVVIGALIKLLNVISKNNASIATGAKSLMMVAGVALAAEGIILGAILIGKMAEKDPSVILEAATVLGAAGGVIYGLVSLIKVVEKHNKNLTKGAKSLMLAAGVALAAEGVILGAIGLGLLYKKDPELIGYSSLVLGMAGGVVLGLVGLVKLVEKHNKDLTKGSKSLLNVALVAAAAEGLILGAVLVAKIQKNSGVTGEEIIGTITTAAGIVTAFGGLAIVAGKMESSIKKGIPGIALAEALSLGATALVYGIVKLVEAKNNANVDWADIFITIGAMATVVTAFGVLAGIAGAPIFAGLMVAGATGLGLAEALALGAALLIGGIVYLVAAKNKLQVEWGDIFITIGAMATVVTAFGVLAGIAGAPAFAALMVAGATGLGLAEALALGGALLIGGIVYLVAAKNKLQVEWKDVFTTIGAMATVVTSFGALAAIAGAPAFAGLMIVGAKGLALAEALALGGALLIGGIVYLVAAKNKLQVEWEDVFTTIGAMATVVSSFGALAAIAGVPIFAALMVAGATGLGLAEALALGAVGLIFSIVKLVDAKNKANVEWEEVYNTIDAMESVVTRFEVLAGIAGLAAPFILLGTPAMAAVTALAFANVDVLRSLVNVVAAVKELGPDGWSQISTAVTTMTNIISNNDKNNPGFSELSKKATANLITIRLGASALKEVALTANVAAGALVQMCNAAAALKDKSTSDITRVISVFYSVTDSMYDMVGFKFMAKTAVIGAARSSINKITLIAADISKAMSDMAMVAGPNGLIRSATVTKYGTIVYGQWVDCAASAETLANSMGSFVTILHESFKDTTKDSFDLIEQGMKMMANIMSPISTFAETLAGFEGQDGKIRVIKYDDKGKQIDTPYVDVRSVAQSIANSVSTFCGVLFSAENQAIWERMTLGGVNVKTGKEGNMHSMYSPSATEAAMGIFATIVDPIGNFTSTLAMFSDGDGTNLMMPIYDSEGNLKETRVVNVVSAATTIGNAVSTFVETLADKSSEWMAIYNSYQRGSFETRSSGFMGVMKETVDTRHNIFADAMGVFANVITPIVSFANMVAMFESGSDNILITIDASTGEKRKVDVQKIALLIGGAITSMITKLGSTFSTQADNLKSISKNQQTIVEIMSAMTGAIAGIGDIDATNANNVIEAYSVLLAKISSLSTTGELESLKTSNESLSTLANNISALGSPRTVKDLNNTVDVFNKMNTSLKNVKESVDVIDKLKASIDTLSSSEGPDSSFDKLSNSVSSFFNIFKDPNFGDVSMATSAIDKILSHIGAAVTGKGPDVPGHIKKAGGIEGLNNKMSDSFLTVKSSLHAFDAALDSGNEKRIKNIKSIAAAVKELNNESTNARDNLTAIKDVLNAIAALSAKSSNGELRQVVNSLNSISIGGGGYGSGGGGYSSGGGGTSKTTIISAVQEALDGLALTGQIPTISVDKMGKITTKDAIIELEIDIDEKEDS